MASALWTAAEAAAATGGQATGDWAATGVSIDTRSLAPGDLFVALQDVRDGHDFVEKAFEAGASAALVCRSIGAGPELLVDDVLPALEALGLAARDRAGDASRVAVTGSVGKTSVKEMIARMFRAAGPAHWSVKSFNNHWGVPLTLARMPSETRNAVFEIGMSTPGEIAPRSRMVRPQIGIVTKIAGVHLEGLGTIEAIADEKSDVSAGLEPNGAAVLPADDRFFEHLETRALAHQPSARILGFGVCERADARVAGYDTDGQGCRVRVEIRGEVVETALTAVGEHWALNAAAALLAVVEAGAMGPRAAAEALAGYGPPPGRGVAERRRLPSGGVFTLIDDAYNANPESMRAALAGLAARPAAHRLVVLGEMGELGAGAAAAHRALARDVAAVSPALVLAAGGHMRDLVDSLDAGIDALFKTQAEDLFAPLQNALDDGDVLLIKGSNASGMIALADRIRQWSEPADQQVMDRGAEHAARGS